MKEQIIKTINTAGLKLKKHGPEIFMVAGIVGTVGSAVLACKATLKATKIIENKKANVEAVHEALENHSKDYSEEDSKKDLTTIYSQTGIKLFKAYAPAVGLGILSISSIIMGQRILKKRNLAIAAAYTVVDKGFKDYRKNVVERFGERVDKELRYNIKAKEVEKTVVDKNGKEKKEKVIEYSVENPSDISEYAKFFDEWTSTEYNKDAEYNLMFLRRQQDYANERLKTYGHVFLNEVYDLLGIPRTRAGQVVGWIKDNPDGDGYIDFGIYNLTGDATRDERKTAFVNGLERNILLDFNVDGIIYDKI